MADNISIHIAEMDCISALAPLKTSNKLKVLRSLIKLYKEELKDPEPVDPRQAALFNEST